MGRRREEDELGVRRVGSDSFCRQRRTDGEQCVNSLNAASAGFHLNSGTFFGFQRHRSTFDELMDVNVSGVGRLLSLCT